MATFRYAVKRFKKSAKEWMTEDDMPAIYALEALATELDVKVTPALIAQYGLTYRNLLSRKPASVEQDELEKALQELDESDSGS